MHTSQQTGAVEIEVTRAMSKSRNEETPVTSVTVLDAAEGGQVCLVCFSASLEFLFQSQIHNPYHLG